MSVEILRKYMLICRILKVTPTFLGLRKIKLILEKGNRRIEEEYLK